MKKSMKVTMRNVKFGVVINDLSLDNFTDKDVHIQEDVKVYR